MKTILIPIPHKKDEYVWIVKERDLVRYLSIRHQTEKFTDIMNRLYKACFHQTDSIIFHPGQSHLYVFAFYFIRGVTDTIASTMVIELRKKEKMGMIWSVCNNFDIKGGYMRVLFDYVIRYATVYPLTRLRLFVRFDNPFYEKAIALYESKGFKRVEPVSYRHIAITMDRELQYVN